MHERRLTAQTFVVMKMCKASWLEVCEQYLKFRITNRIAFYLIRYSNWVVQMWSTESFSITFRIPVLTGKHKRNRMLQHTGIVFFVVIIELTRCTQLSLLQDYWHYTENDLKDFYLETLVSPKWKCPVSTVIVGFIILIHKSLFNYYVSVLFEGRWQNNTLNTEPTAVLQPKVTEYLKGSSWCFIPFCGGVYSCTHQIWKLVRDHVLPRPAWNVICTCFISGLFDFIVLCIAAEHHFGENATVFNEPSNVARSRNCTKIIIFVSSEWK